MEAVIIQMQPEERAAVQTIRRFLEVHRPDAVSTLFWEVMRGYAVNGPKDASGESCKQDEIAALFDDILSLTKAIKLVFDKGRPR